MSPFLRSIVLLAACPLLVVACAEGSALGDGEGATGGVAGAGGAIGGDGVGGMGGGTIPETCGDGSINGGEDCDGDNLAGWSCETLDFGAGDLACGADCTFDTSGCVAQVCGNGMLEAPEECDGTDFGGATCMSLGQFGTIGCDDDCSITGCSDQYEQGFEGATLPAGWTTQSTPWALSATQPHGGASCAQSGAIGNSQASSLTVTGTWDAAGSVSFWHRVSTESGYDFLRFYIDGQLQSEWSGELGWTQATFPVAMGSHTLTWTYAKDGSLLDGSDAVWIDDVVFTGGYVP